MPLTSQYPQYLTPQEVADVLHTSRKTVYRRIASGTIPAVRIGLGVKSPIRVPADALEAWIYATPDADAA